MSHPELSRGDRGASVERLQSLLNRVGTMLKVAGDFGLATERGVRLAQRVSGQEVTGTADDDLWEFTVSQPVPFPQLSIDRVALIAREETGGLGYYESVTRWPHFPGVASGITIGVGYDLRYNTAAEFTRDWQRQLPGAVFSELLNDIGKHASKRRVKELRRKGMVVPFAAAWLVFLRKSLPRYYAMTLAIYPSLPRLPDLCRSVLVSLVYNRGNSLEGARRREMRAIRMILQQFDDNQPHRRRRKAILSDVEDEIVSMQRLWGPESGLHRRRQAEANLWRTGIERW